MQTRQSGFTTAAGSQPSVSQFQTELQRKRQQSDLANKTLKSSQGTMVNRATFIQNRGQLKNQL